ncbi:FxsA family protein [Alteromonas sp. chi3]|uniref:FxsA family protein n=1 Tax=Alteromonas gilva TaxID=2987522 RepID=A0ABT5KXD4_9ALTE|nr:FxsA family protein [Alteromonas gilva]MDC8829425.1 FxsA family protein [Alteromonas gilva]
MRFLLLLFIIMPIAEISLLLQVGDLIGGWNTIGLIVITAFVGAYLVRQEGLSTLQAAQAKMAQNQVPGNEMLEGLLLMIAGVLLVTPGFITDIVGFTFALPFSRKFIAARAAKHLTVHTVGGAQQRTYQHYTGDTRTSGQDADGETIEGEYVDKSANDDSPRLK